jgi:hypothetical protein
VQRKHEMRLARDASSAVRLHFVRFPRYDATNNETKQMREKKRKLKTERNDVVIIKKKEEKFEITI